MIKNPVGRATPPPSAPSFRRYGLILLAVVGSGLVYLRKQDGTPLPAFPGASRAHQEQELQKAEDTLGRTDAAPKEVAEAMLQLARRNNRSVFDRALKEGQSQDPELRAASAVAAAKFKNDESLHLLQGLLQDSEPRVRTAAVNSLTDRAPADWRPTIDQAMKDERRTDYERVRLLMAKVETSPSLEAKMANALELFELASTTRDQSAKRASVLPLAMLLPTKAGPLMERFVAQGNAEIRRDVVRSLAPSCLPNRIEILAGLITHETDGRLINDVLHESTRFVDPRLGDAIDRLLATKARDPKFRRDPYEKAKNELLKPDRVDRCRAIGAS